MALVPRIVIGPSGPELAQGQDRRCGCRPRCRGVRSAPQGRLAQRAQRVRRARWPQRLRHGRQGRCAAGTWHRHGRRGPGLRPVRLAAAASSPHSSPAARHAGGGAGAAPGSVAPECRWTRAGGRSPPAARQTHQAAAPAEQAADADQHAPQAGQRAVVRVAVPFQPSVGAAENQLHYPTLGGDSGASQLTCRNRPSQR